MANIPQKITERLITGIKKFQSVLKEALDREANESDTVIIITAMLSELFGYDTFKEITSEMAIRGTYCDLATKIDDKIQSLIEAKAIHLELKEGYITQAVGYASNKGVDWVVLTNGIVWHIYKVTFTKPIDHEKVVEVNFLQIDHRKPADLELLFLLTKESWVKSALSDYYDQKQALSRFTVSAVLLTDPVLKVVKRELKRISPDIKITTDQIQSVLEQEIFKREVVEGDKADEARKRVAKAVSKAEKNKSEKESTDEEVAVPVQKDMPETTSPVVTPT